MQKNALLFGLLSATILGVWQRQLSAQSPRKDHLVPVQREEGLSLRYKQLYERKLFLTLGEIARYVRLPGLTGTELSVSIYRGPAKASVGPYKVTATIASGRLWDTLPEMTYRIDPSTIKIRRMDASLPEATATLIHQAWLAKIQKMRDPPADEFRLDSEHHIFSVLDSNGKLRRAEAYYNWEETRLMIEIGEALLEYCAMTPPAREKAARKIERQAKALMR